MCVLPYRTMSPALDIGVRGAVNVCAGTPRCPAGARSLGGGEAAPLTSATASAMTSPEPPRGVIAHNVAVAGLHLVGAELYPHAPVSGPVHLYPPRAPGAVSTPNLAAPLLSFRTGHQA